MWMPFQGAVSWQFDWLWMWSNKVQSWCREDILSHCQMSSLTVKPFIINVPEVWFVSLPPAAVLADGQESHNIAVLTSFFCMQQSITSWHLNKVCQTSQETVRRNLNSLWISVFIKSFFFLIFVWLKELKLRK